MNRMRVRPSKASSVGGFIVGLGFLVIGAVIVIPTFGLFGIFWTLMAGVITISHGINLFTRRGISTMTIEEGEDVEDKLQTLERLRRQGLINTSEYDQKKKEILNEWK